MEKLSSLLKSKGFDIVQPLNTLWYNLYAKPKPSLIDFPVSQKSSGLPALLIGNSRDLWPMFLKHVQSKTDGDLGSDPLDQYCRETIEEGLRACHGEDADSVQVFYTFEKAPDRLVAFQRLAEVSGLAQLDEAFHLCIHPIFGVWFGLRAVVIYPSVEMAGVSIADTPPPKLVVHYEKEESQRAAELLLKAIEASKKGDPQAWRIWVEMRDCISLGKQEYRYSDDQIVYHYRKDKSILEQARINI